MSHESNIEKWANRYISALALIFFTLVAVLLLVLAWQLVVLLWGGGGVC